MGKPKGAQQSVPAVLGRWQRHGPLGRGTGLPSIALHGR